MADTQTFISKLHTARQKLFRRTSTYTDASSSPEEHGEVNGSASRNSTIRKASVPSLRPNSHAQILEGRSLKRIDDAKNLTPASQSLRTASQKPLPVLKIQQATPDTSQDIVPTISTEHIRIPGKAQLSDISSRVSQSPPHKVRPSLARTSTKQSYTSVSQHNFDSGLANRSKDSAQSSKKSSTPQGALEDDTIHTRKKMSRRKIWVKRPGASATLVNIGEDDLVDDLRDLVLKKYANSLGRNFDSPDVTIRLLAPDRNQPRKERILNPEEPLCNIIDAFFTSGQSVDDALLIDVPQRRTPRSSPGLVGRYSMNHYHDEFRPLENGNDYFPQMAAASPNHALSLQGSQHSASSNHHAQNPHPMSMLDSKHHPPLPSPRGPKTPKRPHVQRTRTASPSTLNMHNSRLRQHSDQNSAEIYSARPPSAPPLPSPPATDIISSTRTADSLSHPALDSGAPLRSSKAKPYTSGKPQTNGFANPHPSHMQDGDMHQATQIPGLLNGASVPPINVLIVEDNIINLKLLEKFVRKLRVRWSSAMNGREAVNTWRTGGFHLVLMDIQLPIMSGLEATKEIRRLERLNGIGAFARSEDEERGPNITAESNGDGVEGEHAEGDDKLNMRDLFKSPVIIVALTASSLQSDRQEALAAGCNDFLTKPVMFEYFERKVLEWGCMQALIDFDGWRKWKDMESELAKEEKLKEKEMTTEERAKKAKKEARRAAVLAKMGQKG